MTIVLRILVALFALLLLAMGVQALFTPAAMAAGFGIEPLGNHGLNTVRADLGAFFLGTGALLALGLLRGWTLFLLAVALMMAIAATGRLLGFVLDGASQGTLVPLAVELAMVVLLPVAYRKLSAA